MKDFPVLVSLHALDALPTAGKRRAAVLAFVKGLKNYFAVEPDFRLIDPETGRPYFGNNVAGFSVIWWVDAADKEVKVVIIRPSD